MSGVASAAFSSRCTGTAKALVSAVSRTSNRASLAGLNRLIWWYLSRFGLAPTIKPKPVHKLWIS